MLKVIKLILIVFFVIPIFILIGIGVKEYGRMSAEEMPRHGFAPKVRDRKLGFSRCDLNMISSDLIRSDKTRKQMKELAAKRRGGYQNKMSIQ